LAVGVEPGPGLQALAPQLIVWIVYGLVFLWLLSTAAQQAWERLKPMLLFLVAAAVVGATVLNLVHGI
jgi:hypothetical protein